LVNQQEGMLKDCKTKLEKRIGSEEQKPEKKKIQKVNRTPPRGKRSRPAWNGVKIAGRAKGGTNNHNIDIKGGKKRVGAAELMGRVRGSEKKRRQGSI